MNLAIQDKNIAEDGALWQYERKPLYGFLGQ